MAELLTNASKDFIRCYLSELRHKFTVIPARDRGHFPAYWWRPYKITIVVAEGGLAIDFERPLKKKYDSIIIKHVPVRIEAAIFPNLNYSYEPLLRATGKEIVIVGGIITTNQSPYLTMMNGADVQIRDVRFEQAEGIHGYPL